PGEAAAQRASSLRRDKESPQPGALDRRRAPTPAILAIVAAYLALGVAYSLATPPFEASDELWHYPFVKQIADGRGLPVQRPNAEENLARQEGGQPPLYYLLGAAATLRVATGPPRPGCGVNPHAKTRGPLARANKNLVLHGPGEEFPWRGPILAVHLLRLLSVAMGGGTVVLTYAIAREIAPAAEWLAAGAAGVAAFLPEFLFISA